MKRSAFVLMLGLGFLAQPALVARGCGRGAGRCSQECQRICRPALQPAATRQRGDHRAFPRLHGLSDDFQRRFALAGLGLPLLPFVRRMPGLAVHDAEQIHRLDIQYDRLRAAVSSDGHRNSFSRHQPDGRLLRRAGRSRRSALTSSFFGRILRSKNSSASAC